MKVYCVFSWGNSNEYTQYAIFNINLSQICSLGIFSNGIKNEFKMDMVNNPSVFEPLKIYFTLNALMKIKKRNINPIKEMYTYEHPQIQNSSIIVYIWMWRTQ